MTTSNANMPATELTKREYACIHCGVPKTGDPDLDAIIAEGNRQKFEQSNPRRTGGPLWSMTNV